MYPKQHAIVSGTATLFAGVVVSVSSAELMMWTVIGAAAGVLIDTDHVLLSMVVAGRMEDGLRWFRQPIRAVTQPGELLADLEYRMIVFHRIVSHLVVLAVLVYLIPFHVLFLPAAVGLTAHIMADVVWDVKQGTYWQHLRQYDSGK